jgi:ribosome-binding protein aMBF1 (putative translation factor)
MYRTSKTDYSYDAEKFARDVKQERNRRVWSMSVLGDRTKTDRAFIHGIESAIIPLEEYREEFLRICVTLKLPARDYQTIDNGPYWVDIPF